MKTATDQRKKQASKGDRLNWRSLKEVSPVTLSSENTEGKQLTPEDLRTSGKPAPATKNLIVP